MKEKDRIAKEYETIKPYIEAVRGDRVVPRREIDPLFDAAIVANIESGVLGQGLNDAGEPVVYRKPIEASTRPSYQVYEIGKGRA